MSEKELIDYRFEAIEKAIERLSQYDEQRREEIATMKEAVIAIKVSNEQAVTAITELKESLKSIKPNTEDKWFKLFEKIVIALIIMLGTIIGLNPEMFIK